MVRRKLVGWSSIALLAVLTVACSQSDPGITTAVKSKMAADDTVKSYRIDVDTKDRVVTLSGAVDTAEARTRAIELARGTEGVRDVVDKLTISAGVTPPGGVDDAVQKPAAEAGRDAADKSRDAGATAGEKARDASDSAGDVASDATLTTKVKTKFLADTRVSGLQIDVDSKAGVVTLTGTVPTAAEKRSAMALAKDTDGVKSVVDRLKVGR